jgi:hypothetical protein
MQVVLVFKLVILSSILEEQTASIFRVTQSVSSNYLHISHSWPCNWLFLERNIGTNLYYMT